MAGDEARSADADHLDDDAPDPSARRPGVTRADSPMGQEPSGGTRTIAEQIVIALVLAFVFRAFVVEAFIIPTGSMATTLLGAHMRFDCPDCGWDYTVNYATPGGSTLVPPVAVNPRGEERTFNVRCPNCGFRLPREPEPQLDADAEDAHAPPVYYGDRILVLKYLYLFADPSRYDVVVFKNPSRASGAYRDLPATSTEPHQENYIKRLVGLPGESIVLLDGDVYFADDARHKPDDELDPGDFRIARKPEAIQRTLWRVVYDDDFRPRGLSRDASLPGGRTIEESPFRMPWRLSGGFEAVDDGFAITADGEARFDPRAVPGAFHLTDYLAYNQTYRDRGDGELPAVTFGPNYEFEGGVAGVGGDVFLNHADDLRLSFVHHRREGEGPLVATLEGNGRRFDVELRPGTATLAIDGQVVAEHADAGLADVGGSHRLEVAHADYRVTVRVDGDLVLQTTDEQYAPDVAELVRQEQAAEAGPAPSVGIRVSGHVGRLRHVKLYRDVHYTPRNQAWAGRGGGLHPYASPYDFPRDVMRLGDDEYFVIGDNPMLSGDARTSAWQNRVTLFREQLDVAGGRVPGRFLLGKAFFVYWPGGYRPLPFVPPIIPNVGDMRFIH